MYKPQHSGEKDRQGLRKLIVESESRHNRLVKALDVLAPAIASLEIKKGELSEVQKELDDCRETLKILSEATKKEQRSLEAAASGAMSLKVKNMFTRGSMVLKQEETRNRFDHFRNVEVREREREEKLTRRIAALRDEILAFTRQSDKFKSARNELECLYAGIFDSTSADYPEQNRGEAEVQAIEVILTKTSADLSLEYAIRDALKSASKAMASSQEKLQEALCCSSALILANDPETNGLRARHLSEAHNLAFDCRSSLINARKLCPTIRSFGIFTLAEQPLVKTRSESGFRDIIDQTALELDRIALDITAELKAAKLRIASSKDVVDQTSKELSGRQAELLNVRRRIFEQVIVEVREASGPSTLPDFPRRSSSPLSFWEPYPDAPPVYSEAVTSTHHTDGPFIPQPLKPRYARAPPLTNGREKSASYSQGDTARISSPLRSRSPLSEIPPSLPAIIPQSPLPTFDGQVTTKDPQKRWGIVERERGGSLNVD
ncbi:hypothetical protein DL96DRAFT_625428 [Flagelloscypha sp. PMI_526]|nr:hypothetical protein DL96DRAFT_625428 [Flagelloscypha sp. PMI_526]